MSGNFKKEDLRIVKTCKSLSTAMVTLLSRRNFEKITVNDLCEEALVSRAAFYFHFNDKYDLLNHWLIGVRNDIVCDVNHYEKTAESVNLFMHNNQKIISNIINNATNETLELIHGFMSSIIDIAVQRSVIDSEDPNDITMVNFCTGGLVNLLVWQVKNQFPAHLEMVNTYSYNMIKCILSWDARQNNFNL